MRYDELRELLQGDAIWVLMILDENMKSDKSEGTKCKGKWIDMLSETMCRRHMLDTPVMHDVVVD